DLTRRIVLRGASPSERQAGTDKEDDTFDPETPAFPPIAANSDDPHFRSPWLRGAMPVPTQRLIEITNGLFSFPSCSRRPQPGSNDDLGEGPYHAAYDPVVFLGRRQT